MIERHPMTKDGAIQKLLLRQMGNELITARALFMDGLQEHAAYHLMASWHALSILQASQRGASSPPASDFKIDFDQLPIAGLVQKAGEAFTDSYAIAQQLASKTELTDKTLDEMAACPEISVKERRRQRKQLALQFRLAELAYRKLILDNHLTWLRKYLLNKKVLKVGGICLLILAMGGLIKWKGHVLLEKTTLISKKPQPRRRKKVVNKPLHANGDKNKNLTVSINKLQTKMRDNIPWNTHPAYIFKKWIKVNLEKVYNSKKVTISLDNNDLYELTFNKDGEELGKISLPPLKADGLTSRTLGIPEEITVTGYDMVILTAVKGDTCYSVGHLIFSD